MTRRDDQRLEDILASVRAIDPEALAREPSIPWADVAGMRNHLAYRYFDTAQAIVQATIDADLPPLVAAVERLLGSFRQRNPGDE